MALKEKALKRLAEKLNAAGIPYAIGGSWMLCQRGLADVWHDLDVFVSLADAERTDRVLSRLGMWHQEESPAGFHAAYHFDGADIELLADLPLGDQATYRFAPEAVDGQAEVFGVPVPLLCLEDMFVIYASAGREERLARIRTAFANEGLVHPERLTSCAEGTLPEAVQAAVRALLGEA